MRCIEARRMVTPFIKKELSDKEAEQFMKHIEHCPDCMDELDIYFTVYNALDTLDCSIHHKEYDFRKMLEEDLRSTRYAILRRKLLRFLRKVLIGAVEILLLICIYTGVEIKKGETENTTFHRAIDRMRSRHGAVLEESEEMSETDLSDILERDGLKLTDNENHSSDEGPGQTEKVNK